MDYTNELSETKRILLERVRPSYLKVVPDMPKRKDGLQSKMGFHNSFVEWYNNFIEELEHPTGLGCSAGEEKLEVDAVELMKHLLPIYKKSVKDKIEKRRIALLEELKELDE